jgi:ethanolamine transporter EutH
MNWARALVYLEAMAIVVLIAIVLLAAFALGDCLGSTDCHARPRLVIPIVTGGAAVALACLVYRFIRDPRGRD